MVVICSGWLADDAAASDLMARFYGHLKVFKVAGGRIEAVKAKMWKT